MKRESDLPRQGLSKIQLVSHAVLSNGENLGLRAPDHCSWIWSPAEVREVRRCLLESVLGARQSWVTAAAAGAGKGRR